MYRILTTSWFFKFFMENSIPKIFGSIDVKITPDFYFLIILGLVWSLKMSSISNLNLSGYSRHKYQVYFITAWFFFKSEIGKLDLERLKFQVQIELKFFPEDYLSFHVPSFYKICIPEILIEKIIQSMFDSVIKCYKSKINEFIFKEIK